MKGQRQITDELDSMAVNMRRTFNTECRSITLHVEILI